MKGFTLIEIVVAIFLLTVGTVGAFSLIQQTIAFTSIASSQLTATYMAQEGIEIIRNIRDSNRLSGFAWNKGLEDSACLVAPLPPCDFYGDVNLNGVLSAEDSNLIKGFLVGQQLNEEQRKRANLDGSVPPPTPPITIADASLIDNYLLVSNCPQSPADFPVCSKAKFQRKITIAPKGSDVLEVSVEVQWSERGGTHQVTAATELYNWR